MNLKDMTTTDRTFTVDFDEKITVNLRHISREELREIYKRATTYEFIDRQKVEKLDSLKADKLLGQAVIKGWSGIKDGDQDALCTPENIDILMSKHNIFAKFINDICTDIDALVRQEKEAARKN